MKNEIENKFNFLDLIIIKDHIKNKFNYKIYNLKFILYAG